MSASAALARMLAIAEALETRTAAILATARAEPAAPGLRALADRLEAELAGDATLLGSAHSSGSGNPDSSSNSGVQERPGSPLPRA